MHSDLDRIMTEADLDALLVFGPASHNAAMVYFTGVRHISWGYLLKPRGRPAIHIHHPMEREESSATGLATRSLTEFDQHEILEAAGGDEIEVQSQLLQRIFKEYKIAGRVGVYGKYEIGPGLSILRKLDQALSQVEIVGEANDQSVLMAARLTKSDAEVERIRRMGKITTSVVGDVANFLTALDVRENVLVDREGQPVTIADVKHKINLWLAMRGAENPEGTIFSIGRDAGIPHSGGTDADPIPIGQPIIFDIFPCETGGGYYYDFTRTWSLGYATDEVQATYDDVLEVYQAVSNSILPNTPCAQYQVQTCNIFEAKGHPTVHSSPDTTVGYVHSLAHGLGLDVHEAPVFRSDKAKEDQVLPGMVFSLEPGLYYPERGLGVRIEDTIWMRPDGTLEILADYPKDLVLKLPRM
ncbi:MAG: aminopeptidase P family protein [Anaerolineales bacterium]|nr:MAG: aminopeptidase P family protein [Anaerolineales bacterium]